MSRLIKKTAGIQLNQLPKADIESLAKDVIKRVVDQYVIAEYCINNDYNVDDVDLNEIFLDEGGLQTLWEDIQDEYNNGESSPYSSLDAETKKYLDEIVSNLDFKTILKDTLEDAEEIVGQKDENDNAPYGPGMSQSDFI